MSLKLNIHCKKRYATFSVKKLETLRNLDLNQSFLRRVKDLCWFFDDGGGLGN